MAKRRSAPDGDDLPTRAPSVLFTADVELAEQVQRLAAAAGAELRVSHDPVVLTAEWERAPLVLIGADLVSCAARAMLPRREGVHVAVPASTADDVLYRAALLLGAESVVPVAAAPEWLVERLAEPEDGVARGVTVGFVGGSGGAGATLLACAVAQVARAPAVVIDVDPWGPGAGRVLGIDAAEGIDWEALGAEAGRIGAQALRRSLPRRGDVHVLGWSGRPADLSPGAVREALSAAQRGHAVVAIDLPRRADDLVLELAARCDLVVVAVRCTALGLASAARTVLALDGVTRVGLALRSGAGRLGEAQVERAVGAPVVAHVGRQRGVGEQIGLGIGPVRSARGALARAADEVLAAARAAHDERRGTPR